MKENKKRTLKLRDEFKELMNKYDLDEDSLNNSIHGDGSLYDGEDIDSDEESKLIPKEWLSRSQEI